jgi:hypothetical protein
MSRPSTEHPATTRAGVTGDIHDIRALTDTGAISLPGRTAPTSGDRAAAATDGTRPTARAAR